MDLLVFKWELVVNNKLENKMHKINDEGEIVDKDGCLLYTSDAADE